MKKFSFFQMSLLLAAIVGLAFSPVFLHAQQIFSVSQNGFAKERVAQLTTQIERSEVVALSLSQNNEKKDVYPFALSSARDAKVVILNEQTGNHVVINPVNEPLAELQLAPFFLEELRQGVLGDAEHYLIVEAASDNTVTRAVSVPVSGGDVFLPRYFYGAKENVKEATPQERNIIGIFKAKPQLISADPDNAELQKRIARMEEERSYYVYMYKLPDGTLCTYDEHFNPDVNEPTRGITADGPLQFDLKGNMTTEQRTATEYALLIWSKNLGGKVPIDIQVDFVDMGDPDVLGGSYFMPSFANESTQTWYPSTLWNQLVGYDATTMRDIRIEMNSIFSWYLGTDGNTSYYQYDFVTVMLHEVNHGLGFADNIDDETGKYAILYWEDNEWYYSDWPGAFDRQLFQGTTGPCVTELSNAERAAVIISGNLYSGRPGGKLMEANSSQRVKMYAPNPYQPGSSVCHWDYYVSFTTFMRYAIGAGESCHTVGTREVGMLLDIGWTQSGGTGGDCNGVTNLNVNFNGNCDAQLSWSAPTSSPSRDVVFTEGFEGSIDWKTITYSGNTWSLTQENPPNIYPHGGSYCIVNYWKENEARDAWAFSPAISLTAGQQYDVKFWLQLPGYPSYNEHDYFELKIGQDISVAAMTTSLYNNTSTYIPNWTQISATFTPGAGGTYYLGFHTFTPTDEGNFILVDDIEISTSGGSGGDITYNVYRDGTKITSVNTTSYTDTGANPSQSHTWEVTVACSGGGESDKASVTKGCNVGIAENETGGITVYPNPTDGKLRVTSNELQVTNVEIFDVYGRNVSRLTSHISHPISMDISFLPAGVYFVRIQTENGIIVKKIIKN